MKPAILGGTPQFAKPLGIVAPLLPDLDLIEQDLRTAIKSGQVTNRSHYAREFECAVAEFTSVPHAVTVANGTLGLILALSALKKTGEVILPSYTFSASAHAAVWAHLKPKFVDILPDTFTIDPEAVEAAITDRTVAILGVHIYGHPCEVDELERIARQHDIPLLFDAAHAFGSMYRGERVGRFGSAEVFSFHATKVFAIGEGGCVTTGDPELAEFVKLGSAFGDPGDGNTVFAGLNAKMQEFNALLGLRAMTTISAHIENRRRYANYIIERLSQLPGLSFQEIRPYVETNFQNLCVLVDEEEFGLGRDSIVEALAAENIYVRRYFYPPLHAHHVYANPDNVALPITDRVASQVLCLPIYSKMSSQMLTGLCEAILRIHANRALVRQHIARERINHEETQATQVGVMS